MSACVRALTQGSSGRYRGAEGIEMGWEFFISVNKGPAGGVWVDAGLLLINVVETASPQGHFHFLYNFSFDKLFVLSRASANKFVTLYLDKKTNRQKDQWTNAPKDQKESCDVRTVSHSCNVFLRAETFCSTRNRNLASWGCGATVDQGSPLL